MELAEIETSYRGRGLMNLGSWGMIWRNLDCSATHQKEAPRKSQGHLVYLFNF